MLNSIIKKLKKEKKMEHSISYLDLYNYPFIQNKNLNNILKFSNCKINLNNFLIEDYFKKPTELDVKKDKTGIPYEVYCQVGDYLYEKSHDTS